MNYSQIKLHAVLAASFLLASCSSNLPTEEEYYDQQKIVVASNEKHFAHSDKGFFNNKEDDFRFMIVGDRTAGHQPGVFAGAVSKVNLLRPDFVMSVGDLIEGNSDSAAALNQQWDEFEAIVEGLNSRFFYVPGHRDISSSRMAQIWQERRGPSYYHFVYRDVLFLVLDTQAPSQINAAEEQQAPVISAEQLTYMRNAIEDNNRVRWTMVFMHKPAWGAANQNFDQLETGLQSRPYTMVAGHNHRYAHVKRFGRDYVIMGTTGAAPHPARADSADHVSLVTITDDGPLFANIKLDGLHNIDGPDR